MNNPLRSLIIDKITENRISSTEVADALYKTGVLEGIKAFNSGHFIAGNVEYVSAYNGSNNAFHHQISNIKKGSVVYVDCVNCGERAVFGDVVSKFLLLYKNVKAVVVNGFLRDAHRLRKENYPIWLKGVTPLGCVNTEVELDEKSNVLIEKNKAVFQNSIIVCDDSGCTLIEKNKINEHTAERLDFIELQEDIWYYCINTLKWDTYTTICEKRYLKEKQFLPKVLLEKLEYYELRHKKD